jgi:hypothetical protein
MIWKLLLGFLTGPLSKISEDIKEAYQSKLNAVNDAERIAADERIALLEARKTSILAAQSDPIERWVRIGLALPFVIYINKLVLWDKVLAWGSTDPLSPELYQIMMLVLGGYFVDTIARKVLKR